MNDDTVLLQGSPVNWKKNLLVIWLSQFLAMVGFGCCMPFIPLLLKENLHVDDDSIRGLYVSISYSLMLFQFLFTNISSNHSIISLEDFHDLSSLPPF